MNFELTSAQRTTHDAARALGDLLLRRADELVATSVLPPDLQTELAERRWLVATLSQELGGAGLDWVASVGLVEELSRAGGWVGLLAGLQVALAEAIVHQGRDEQREAYVKPLAKGELLLSLVHGESIAGSRALTATPVDEGWRLEGAVPSVAGALQAEAFVVVITTAEGGAQCWLVPKGTSGLLLEGEGDATWAPGRVCFERCVLPASTELGTSSKRSFMAEILARLRLVAAAHAVGVARRAFEAALEALAPELDPSGSGSEQAASLVLAEMATRVDAARLLTFHAADALSSEAATAGVLGGEGDSAAAAKLYASTTATWVTERAEQLCAFAGDRSLFATQRRLAWSSQRIGGDSDRLRERIGRTALGL